MTQFPTAVVVTGYNEPPEHFDRLRRGLRDYGIESLAFAECVDTLSARIDRFADFLETRKRAGGEPLAAIGYSLGGLVVRGFLRRYPHRAGEITHTAMIATPNWGVQTMAMPFITRLLRIPDLAFADMDLRSDFLRWLNGTSGHWVTGRHGWPDWVLDDEPWIGPPGARMLVVMGLIPSRGGDNDGLVWGDSATLASRIPAHFIVGPHANHMNVIGHFDPLAMLAKGFLANERVWPLTVRAIAGFLGAQPAAGVEGSVAI